MRDTWASMSIHPPSCNCSRHTLISANQHACYRQLAHAILGPLAPDDELELVHALAEHARFLPKAQDQRPAA